MKPHPIETEGTEVAEATVPRQTEREVVQENDTATQVDQVDQVDQDALLQAYLHTPSKFHFYQLGLFKMQQAGIFSFRWHWSWWAFGFSWGYLLYRKAYMAAGLTFLASLLFSGIPVIGNLLFMIIMGGVAPYFVLKRYHDLATQLSGTALEQTQAMQNFGGVNKWVVWVTIIIYAIAALGVLAMLFSGDYQFSSLSQTYHSSY